MAKDQLILPRADFRCGKTFYSDRRTADGHRIALEFWNQATGHVRAGYQLTVHRCERCGGFHISRRRIGKPAPEAPRSHKSLPAAERIS
jgi:hypothetical protein